MVWSWLCGGDFDPSAYADTMIGIAAQAVLDGELSDIEAISTLTLLIAAGGESTTSLTGTGVRILAERPDLQDRLGRAVRARRQATSRRIAPRAHVAGRESRQKGL
jgi:cytochrome P450